MRSGCLNVVFVLIAASVATVLTVVGAALFLSFAALTLETSEGIETVLKMVVALVAGYFFIRVGWSVWQDLRGRKVGSGDGKQEERRSAGDGSGR